VHGPDSLENASRAVEKALADATRNKTTEVEQLEDIIAKTVARSLARSSRREPLVIAVALDA
jgi:ribonuclease J